jgi:hypothetical protein
MENNKFTWGEWENNEENKSPEGNTINWGDENVEENKTPEENPLNWGVYEPEKNTLNWGDENVEEIKGKEDSFFTSEEESIKPPSLEPNLPSKLYSALGSIPRIEVKNNLYQLYIDNVKAISDLRSLDLTPRKGDDGRYDFDPKTNTELGKIIESIVSIAIRENLRVTDCTVIINKVNESVLNIFRGKPTKSFIYILQGNNQSGDIVLDLASMGGPATKLIDNYPGLLSVFDGWVPFHISKNNSDDDLIIIAGTLGI